MGETDIALTVDQKIAAGLIDVIAAVSISFHPFAQELYIEHQRCRRKNAKPGEPGQINRSIGLALRIGEHGKRPLVMFLILDESEGLGERDDRNRDAAPIEFGLEFFHLAEVSLARQSGEMAEKDQKQMLLETTAKCDPLTVQIEQRQFIESNFFHATTGLARFDRRRHALN